MNISYIRTFCQVVRLGSFSEAARVLHLSQPAVSQHVRAVETEMQAVLLDRGGGLTRLTAEGEEVYPLLRDMLDAYDKALDRIQAMREQPKGILRLVATFSIGDYLLPSLLVRFQERYPGITVQVTIMNTEQAARSIRNGDYGLGLVEGPVTGSDLHRSVFAHDELVLIVAPTHEWAEKETIEPQQLLEYKWVTRELGSGTRQIVEDRLEEAGLKISDLVIMELGSTEAVKAAVVAGVGPAFVSAMAVENELRLNILKRIFIRNFTLERPLSIIWSKQRPRTFSEQVFSKFALQYESIKVEL